MYIANCTDDPVEYDSTGGGGGKAPKKPLAAHQVTKDAEVVMGDKVTFYDSNGDLYPGFKIKTDDYLVILDTNAQGKLVVLTYDLMKVLADDKAF